MAGKHDGAGGSGKLEDGTGLYEILGVSRTASSDEIRKAYLNRSLELHPDKNPGNKDAMENFQRLHNAFKILSDPDKRAIYDQMGIEMGDSYPSVYELSRRSNQRVTLDDIESFHDDYRGSEAETKDLKDLYTKHDGDMDEVFAHLMCSKPSEDSYRFMGVIDEAISSGELMETPEYRMWKCLVSEEIPEECSSQTY
ncbi:hypothetical protein SELMODRAFT_427767 [Selaginella moellendorffii]|uniref:J domain-containing protein n=1 Tax=Selaginella moellendorffii TaxID=88036 RepID=D8T0M7_SELML|nr:chaperone protein dnaJ 6 [Selaginella moellendorffii]EFJ09768.1 hypothetical protein SELMODRAFT_427767 [Selaginella moellendorffii]|eukprot:XP_002989174.1 chaperone protein dnaJ 6 [Selaginella moellendorffii]